MTEAFSPTFLHFNIYFFIIKLSCVHNRLVSVFLELNKNPVEGFSAGLIEDSDIYRWEVLLIGPPDTL